MKRTEGKHQLRRIQGQRGPHHVDLVAPILRL